MANAVVLVYASMGLVGIVFGIRAWRYLSRAAANSPQLRLNRLRSAALVVGLALAIGSFFLAPVFSYPVSMPQGSERIIGWPFFVAYQGRGYSGFVTYLGALGDFAFWLLAPQFPLASYVRRVAPAGT